MDTLKPRSVKLFHFLFKMTMLIGSLYQLIDYMSVYFEYPTLSKSAPYVPIQIEMPRFSLCFAYLSLLNPDIKSEFHDKIDRDNLRTSQIMNMSVASLFDVTPDSDKLLASCAYRFTDKHELVERFDTAECVDKFKIAKYFTQGYVCYMFNPHNFREKLDLSLIATHVGSRRILFDLAIAPPLSNGYKVLPLIHYHEKAYFDMIYNMDLLPSLTNNETFVLYFDIYQMSFARKPYKNGCVEGIETASLCRVSCMNAIFAPKKLFYGAAFVFDRSERSFLASEAGTELANEEYKASIACSEQCKQTICEDSFTVTYFSQPFRSTKKLNFIVESNSGVSYRLKQVPKIPLEQFLLESATVISVWLGLSVLGVKSLLEIIQKFVTKREDDLAFVDISLEDLVKRFRRVKYLHSQIRRTIMHLKLNISCETAGRRESCFMSRSRVALKLVSVAIQIGILITLIVELYNLISKYLAYNVRVSYYLNVVDTYLEIPTLVVCTSVASLFNLTTGPIYNLSTLDSMMIKHDRITNRSVEDLFKETLTPYDFVKGCRVRKQRYYELVHHNTSATCSESFEMTKFYMNQQICYKIRPITETTRRKIEFYRQTMDTPGVIYSIIPDIDTLQYDELEIILYQETPSLDYPTYSREYSYNLLLERNRKQLYLVTYLVSQFELLGPPFTTDCRARDTMTYRRCVVDKMAREMKILPYSQILGKPPSELHVLSYTNMRSDIVTREMARISDFCDKYNRSPCHMTVIKTSITYPLRSDEAVELAVHIPMSPRIMSKAEALFELPTIVKNCACAISFWLGFNMLLLDPLAIYLYTRSLPAAIEYEKLYRKIEDQLYLIKEWTYGALKVLGKKVRNIHVRPKIQTSSSTEIQLIKLIVNKSYLLACFVGCVYQSSIFSLIYFKFPTEMNTEVTRDSNNSVSRLTVCSRLDELLFNQTNTGSLFNLTTEEMFDRSPTVQDVVTTCGARGWQGNDTEHLPEYLIDRIFLFHKRHEECSLYFNFARSIKQEFICYTAWPKKLSPVRHFEEYLYRPKLLYSVAFNSSISSSVMMVSVSDSMPKLDIYSPNIYNSDTKTATHFVSYSKCVQHILPHPYDNDGYTSPAHIECVNNCIEREIGAKNVTIFNVYHLERSHSRYIRYMSDENEMYFAARNNCINSVCKQVFDKRDTYTTYITTVSQLTSWQEQEEDLSFYVFSTFFFVLVVRFREAVSWYDYGLQIGSVISIWFGLSILDLNPAAWILRRFYFNRREKGTVKRMQLLDMTMSQVEVAQGSLSTSLVMRMQTGFI